MPLRADRFGLGNYLVCLHGILVREGLRFLNQRERFISSLVQAAALAVHLRRRFPPGARRLDHPALQDLCALRGLHHARPLRHDPAFQRHAVVAVDGLRPRDGQHAHAAGQPLSRAGSCWSRSCSPASSCRSRRSMLFLAIAWFWGVKAPPLGYLMVLPALFLAGLMLGALGLLLSSMIKQLENFAGVMNFVIFPMYFASPALYPLWRIQEASPLLYKICLANPFTYAVELIRFAFYGQVEWISLAVVDRMHRALPRRRNHRLRSLARPDDPEAGHGRKRLMQRRVLFRNCRRHGVSCGGRRNPPLLRQAMIPTGPASSAKCRNCRSARSGTGQNCRYRQKTGRRIRISLPWSLNLRHGECRSPMRRRKFASLQPLFRPTDRSNSLTSSCKACSTT